MNSDRNVNCRGAEKKQPNYMDMDLDMSPAEELHAVSHQPRTRRVVKAFRIQFI